MAFILWQQDLGALRSALAQVDPIYLAVSTLAFLFGQLLLATRWWTLMRGLRLDVPLSAAIKLHLLGLFYNNILPSSVGGDVIRAYYVARHTDNPIAAATSVLVDRVVALISMGIMLALILVLWPGLPVHLTGSGARRAIWKAAPWALMAAGCLLTAGGLIWLLWPRLAEAALRRLRPVATTLAGCAGMYWRRPYVPLGAMGLTIVLQMVIIVAFWMLGRGMGIPAGLVYYLVIFPLTWLLSAIPITIAGAGLLEGGIVGLFVHLAGVSQEKALALALCQRFAWMVTSLPGGVIHLLGRHKPAAISVDCGQRTT